MPLGTNMSDAVAKLLTEKGIYYKISGKDLVVNCLNPDHDDSSPSLRINSITGISHCFSCGWKRNIFRHFGIISNNASVKTAKLKEKLANLKLLGTEIDMPAGHTPYTQIFRGISIATLKHFGAFYTYENKDLEDRIVFPIKDVSGKHIAFIGRHVLSNANPKYYIYPGGRSLPCMPSILEEASKTVVLVEGIFDMLNLYDKGMRNVSCVFGTDTLKNSTKERMLPFKVQGIEKVFILFDGDKAGRDAAATVKPLLEEEGFVVEIVNLPDDTDPGELDQASVSQMIEYTK